MEAKDRGQRLKIDTRLAILDDIMALNKQRKAAIQAGDVDNVNAIQVLIDKLNDQLDELSFLSVEALDNSPEVKATITELRAAADRLEDEADNITDIASALTKGAEFVDGVAGIITKLRGLV